MLLVTHNMLLFLVLLFGGGYLRLFNSVSLSALLAANHGVLNVIHGSGMNKFALKADPSTGALSKHKILHELFATLKNEYSKHIKDFGNNQCFLKLNITQHLDDFVISIPSLDRVIDDRGRASQDMHIAYHFTRDFRFINLKHLEAVLIEGYEKDHVFILDSKINISTGADTIKCVQWAPRRLFRLNVPMLCVKDHKKPLKVLPVNIFGHDEIEVALNTLYEAAFDPDLIDRKCWIYISHHYQRRYTSQGPQDGLLEFIFNRIGITNKFAVEFGYDGSNDNGNNTVSFIYSLLC